MVDLPPGSGGDTGVAPDGGSTISTPRWVQVFGIIALVLVMLFVVRLLTGGDGSHGPGQHTVTGGPGEAVALEASPVEGAEELTITATEMAFEPEMIELVAGEPVNLTFVNDGKIDHDWELEEVGLHLRADPGEQAAQAVVVDEPGTYEAVCTEPGHTEAGMTMTIEVSPSGAHTPPAGGH